MYTYIYIYIYIHVLTYVAYINVYTNDIYFTLMIYIVYVYMYISRRWFYLHERLSVCCGLLSLLASRQLPPLPKIIL